MATNQEPQEKSHLRKLIDAKKAGQDTTPITLGRLDELVEEGADPALANALKDIVR